MLVLQQDMTITEIIHESTDTAHQQKQNGAKHLISQTRYFAPPGVLSQGKGYEA
jgi:hypothetical protein